VLGTAAGAGFLLGGRGVPLAAASGQPWVQAELTLTEPAVLICYSDGLIERRGTDVDTMLDRLLAVTSTLADRPLTEVCDGLLEQLVGGLELGDDVALLCASLQPVPTAGRARVYHRILAARPATLVELRRDLRAWAEEVGLDRVTTADLVLATGEACANAIEHAYQGERPGEVELRAWLEPGEGRLAARVTDTGRWQERVHERTGRGRGLGLIRATMTEVEIRGGPTGTTVTIGRGLRPPLPLRSDLV
jgi:anti-sigma regulatory factor (Ser/Thr protein kinase)